MWKTEDFEALPVWVEEKRKSADVKESTVKFTSKNQVPLVSSRVWAKSTYLEKNQFFVWFWFMFCRSLAFSPRRLDLSQMTKASAFCCYTEWGSVLKPGWTWARCKSWPPWVTQLLPLTCQVKRSVHPCTHFGECCCECVTSPLQSCVWNHAFRHRSSKKVKLSVWKSTFKLQAMQNPKTRNHSMTQQRSCKTWSEPWSWSDRWSWVLPWVEPTPCLTCCNHSHNSGATALGDMCLLPLLSLTSLKKPSTSSVRWE